VDDLGNKPIIALRGLDIVDVPAMTFYSKYKSTRWNRITSHTHAHHESGSRTRLKSQKGRWAPSEGLVIERGGVFLRVD